MFAVLFFPSLYSYVQIAVTVWYLSRLKTDLNNQGALNTLGIEQRGRSRSGHTLAMPSDLVCELHQQRLTGHADTPREATISVCKLLPRLKDSFSGLIWTLEHGSYIPMFTFGIQIKTKLLYRARTKTKLEYLKTVFKESCILCQGELYVSLIYLLFISYNDSIA